MENKQEICKKLYELLKITRAGEGLVSIDYEKDGQEEYAKVCWQQGEPGGMEMFMDKICITGDSGRAIILDVLKGI